jgi:ribosomal protein S18 acetylase RimI-like enzyme
MATTAVLAPEQRVDRLPGFRRLVGQLSPQIAELSDEVLARRLCDDRVIIVVVQRDDDELVATATLSVSATVSHGIVGHVDDVVVDETSRGQGIGKLLMQAVHAEAERLELRHVDLTSRPSREAANALYRSLGYERRDTNAYRLRLRNER